jgi:DinB superfamily
MMIFVSMAAAAVVNAQAPPTPITDIAALKSSYAAIKANITKAAERMPEDQYGFKASPDIRTFGALIGHIADVQGRFCAVAGGTTPPASAADKTAKADLVAALKGSYAVCDPVFDALTDADSAKMVSMGRGAPRSKTALLWTLIIGHSNEEYGYLAVYMRIKGIVPPSTQP